MNKTSSYSTDTLFRGLKSLLNSLPTEKEKSELLRNLREAQSFLEEMQVLVGAIPTMESSRDLSEGLSRLNILTDRAYHDAGLRKLLGIRGQKSSMNEKKFSSEATKSHVNYLEATIACLETPEITDLLSNESLSILRDLASQLHIRTPSKERKSDLVKRIATYIENQRGFSRLRGKDSE